MTRPALGVELWDSFSAHAFGGNVAGVVLDAAGLSAEHMQLVAAELGAPTTGFLTGPGIGSRLKARFFTPTEEIAMCGHVVVALASALRGSCSARRVELGTAAGPVVVRMLDDGSVAIELPSWNRLPASVSPSAACEVLGMGAEVLDGRQPLGLASAGLRHLFVPLRTVDDLSSLQPDPSAVRSLGSEIGFDTLGAYTVITESESGATVRLRDFTAPIGVDEEPASGTTTGALAGLLASSAAGRRHKGRYVTMAQQGVELGRPSNIQGVVSYSPRGPTLEVHGRAHRTLTGTMTRPDGATAARS